MPGVKLTRTGRYLIGVVGAALLTALLSSVEGQQYTLNFSKSSTRMRWDHRLPSWSYSVPVRLSAPGDSTSMLRISSSASMGFTLDERADRKTWQDNTSVNGSVNYPILGPRATIGIGANMSVRNATLTKQKLRNQSFNFRFQYRPLQKGRFKSLMVNVTPGLITASRASRANLDSTIEEQGVRYNASLRVSPDVRLAGRKLNNSVSLSKKDDTLKSNKNRNESFNSSLGYTLPGGVRTSISLSESRSQMGVSRSVISQEEVDGEVKRDTVVAVELQETRNTNLSSSVNFKAGRFEVKGNSSYGENMRNNTASAAEDPGNRFFGTDRESKRWSFGTSASGKLTEKLVGNTNVTYTAKDEGFLPVILADGREFRDPTSDREDRDLSLRGSLDLQLSDQHRIALSGQVRSIKDENPGTPEQNRDSFSRTARIAYNGTLSSGTKLSIALRTDFFHKVNLHASRSSDNSRTRDIGLDISTRYERLGISFSHNFGISAKRAIFDFDRQLNAGKSLRRSNIRRGWSMVHSLRRPFFDHLQFNGRYSYRADDSGKLIVENQTQVVEVDNGDHTVGFGMSYSPGAMLTTSVNYSYRLDRQWEHQYASSRESRVLGRENEHQNLSMNVNYNPSSVTRLTMRGSRSRQRSGTFDSFNVTYSRTI